MHQRSDVKSKLKEILSQYTSVYKIEDAQNDQKVKPSTIYLAPENKQMVVLNDYIFLLDSKPKHFSKPSISISFESLSNEYKEQFMAIVVCGYGQDGSDALKTIKDNGGVVLIQQLYECQATPMLEAAINTKNFDKIMSINDISLLLYNKITKENNINIHLNQFLENIFIIYGYDYRNYHKQHIIRRIEYTYNILKPKNFKDFEKMVLEDKEIFKNLFLDISVNVTTFFRNPEVYSELKSYLKQHFSNKDSIKIWCAGCSSGEEPYSIAIILKELGVLDRSLIYATDINDMILQFAKNGAYSNKSYELFKEYYHKADNSENFDQYFNHFDNFVTIKDEIKKNVLFFRHNLVSDGILNEFQLIICRNVLIYFNKDLTLKVFDLFDRSLESGGVLLLGQSETFYYDEKKYQPIDQMKKIFIKKKSKDG
jgi:chemotaxis protein methyltransferase CheR